MRLTFELELPEALYRELISLCQGCSCSPKQYAAEAVEAQIAGYRLTTKTHAPRVPEPEDVEEVEAEVVAALSPSDIPTLEEQNLL